MPRLDRATETRLVQLLGAFLILSGLALNEWTLAAFLTDDGHITPSHRVAVWVLDVVLVGAGLLLVRLRERVRVVPLALLLGTTALALVVAELALREVDERQSRDYLLLRENPHGTGSYRLKPDLDLLYQWEILGDTRWLHVETNSAGMRWGEVPLEKTRPRVAFVGDSFTFGESARSNDRTFAAVFDAELRARVGEDWEVLNFGVPGFGPPDVELIVEEEVLRYDPDWLVYVLYNGNDFRDAYLGRDKYDVSRGDAVWFPELLNERIPPSWRPHEYVSERVGAKPLLWNLRLFRRLSRGIKEVEAALGSEALAAGPPFSLDDFEASDEFLAYTFWSRAEYPPVALEARDVALACLDRIRERCAERGVRLLVAALPTREQVYCRELTGVGANGVPYDVRNPQAHVEAWAAARGVPYLDLLPPLRAGAARGEAPVFDDLDAERGDIHMNDAGHRAVGTLLAEFFARTTRP